MPRTARLFQSALLVLLVAMAFLPAARAQDAYPSKPVTLIVPWPPAGPTDLVGRLVAARLGALWKQQVIVENKPGAQGTIGTLQIARAAPDGYTLGLGTQVSPAFELLNPKLMQYNSLRDLASVGFIGTTPLIMLVRADFPARNVKEFVAYAKANPTKVQYASAGDGSPPHFAAEFLIQATGIQMLQVPFNGTAPAVQALMGGQVDTYIGSVASVMPAVQAGKGRLLAAVSAQRISSQPNLPTMAEEGIPNVTADAWYGVIAPAKVPEALLDRINADLRNVLSSDEVNEQLKKLGFERRLGTRADFDQFMRDDIVKLQKLIVAAKIKVNN